MTTEEKDAEIERLKGELAESLAVLKPFDRSLDTGFRDNIILQAFDDDTQEYWCVGPSIGDMRAVRAFLQKHTPPLNCGSAAAGESPSHSGGGGYVGKALSGDWPTKDDALALYADESNWLGYYPPDLKPRPKVWVWQGPVLPPWEAAQNVTGKSALREVPPTDHARWLRLLDRALCGCFSLDCRVHGAYDCNDHKWVEAHRQKHEKGAGV